MALVDSFGRRISYLRLSVTDRCNFRCRYCMPAAGSRFLPPTDVLSDEEIVLVARAAAATGVEKIRVTGGEPLMRTGIARLLSVLASIDGLKKLVLTTNGFLLGEAAGALRAAGVESLNVSLDSLRPGTFAMITRGGALDRVLDGISAAEKAGFPRLKINVVLMRGINDCEVFDFAALTLDRPLSVRFIEYMPVAGGDDWRRLVVPADVVLRELERRYRLRPAGRELLGGPARCYRIAGAAGSIGLITPLSCGFCGDCNRIRVTAAGFATGCLFAREGIDLMPFLRPPRPRALRDALVRLAWSKPESHGLSSRAPAATKFPMSRLGG